MVSPRMPVFVRQLPSQSCNLRSSLMYFQGSFFASRLRQPFPPKSCVFVFLFFLSTFSSFGIWNPRQTLFRTPPELHHTKVEDVEPPSPPPEPKSNLRRRRPKPLSWEPQLLPKCENYNTGELDRIANIKCTVSTHTTIMLWVYMYIYIFFFLMHIWYIWLYDMMMSPRQTFPGCIW